MKVNTLIRYIFPSLRTKDMFLGILIVSIVSLSFEPAYSSNNRNSIIEEIQQNPFTANGVITDALTGEPLIGANVIEKGTLNGTVTNSDGTFQLAVQNNRASLVVSYIGYQTLEVPVSTNMNISMSEDSELMDEVVVILSCIYFNCTC